jgi:predicted lipoprotein with Yx(FWY)xxD motif
MTMRWTRMLSAGAVATGAALAVAACGGGSGTSGAAGTSDGSTVSVRNVDGVGTALTSADGRTLYFAEQETGGQIRCTDACLSFWTPLTVSGGSAPTAGSGVTGTLATVTRPDGKVQVTYDGKPLYEFTQDGGAGQAKGNGFKDSFNNAQFTWHAATPSGGAPTGPAPTNTGNDNGYGY